MLAMTQPGSTANAGLSHFGRCRGTLEKSKDTALQGCWPWNETQLPLTRWKCLPQGHNGAWKIGNNKSSVSSLQSRSSNWRHCEPRQTEGIKTSRSMNFGWESKAKPMSVARWPQQSREPRANNTQLLCVAVVVSVPHCQTTSPSSSLWALVALLMAYFLPHSASHWSRCGCSCHLLPIPLALPLPATHVSPIQRVTE